VDQLHGVVPDFKSQALQRGTDVHDWLAKRPKDLKTLEIVDGLAKFKVKSSFRSGTFFPRQYKDFNVMGDIDDIVLVDDKYIRILENKTIRIPERIEKFWYVSPYVFQVGIYCWILEPIVKEIGYRLADTHLIQWFSSLTALPAECPTCGRMFERTQVRYDEQEVLSRLEQIHAAYHDPNLIIYPKIPWKCERCDEVYRRNCPKGNLTLA